VKLHHIGIVTDKKNIKNFFFKKKIDQIVVDNFQKNKLLFQYNSENKFWFEYVVPLSANSTVYNFLKKKGGGVHHFGYLVENIKKIKSQYMKNKNYIYLNSYKINIPCFGGDIETCFFYNNNFIIEFLANVKKK
jgi:hypothetical protein